MRRSLLTLSVLLAVAPLSATSYVPVTDEALVADAPVIAVARIEGSGFGEENARPFTGYQIRIERVLKGPMASGLQVTVRVPGGVRSDGMALKVWGAPRFAPGERVLLFLSPRLDGTYEIVHLMLGAFHEIRGLAVRNLSEARAVGPRSPEPVRDFDRFVRWVAARARGMRLAADYQIAGSITEEFTLFEDPETGANMRWFEFDQGNDVPWLAHQSGQVGVSGGGFAEFQAALSAWNADGATNIDYTYAGTTTDTSGLIQHDTLNVILFNDPNNELPSFSCFSGGVLAYGGPWYPAGTTLHRGIPYHQIANADIVVNNGLTCFFEDSPDASKAAEELFAHELGHTLGIDHSEEDQALMRPFIHDDGRGAALHADDRAAIAYLYTAPAPAADLFTLPPCRLIDTRNPDGPYGGPALQSGQLRTFAAAGQCGIPATAVAISINVTAVSPSGGGLLTLFPSGPPLPNTSTLSFSAGQTRANNMLLMLSGASERAFTVVPALVGNGTVHVLVDVNGYFE
ncbi:MAG TPA: matrixin family metalloprotease [Thermoanaerobaculia bacterium]|nr:matrixin family metalloprotease [Thermoanaerobaculia bacterium]